LSFENTASGQVRAPAPHGEWATPFAAGVFAWGNKIGHAISGRDLIESSKKVEWTFGAGLTSDAFMTLLTDIVVHGRRHETKMRM